MKNMHITSSLWLLRVVVLAATLSLSTLQEAAMAQEKKPRRKFKAWLMRADSLRLELRRSADRGQMLQWTDSIIMAEINKSKMSEKRKQRYMRRHIKYRNDWHVTTANCSVATRSWLPTTIK